MRRILGPGLAARLVAGALVMAAMVPSSSAATLPPDGGSTEVTGGMLVHLRPGVPMTGGIGAAISSGARIGTHYPMIDVFVAYGTTTMFDALGASRFVDHLEPNLRLDYMTDTSHVATRGRELFEGPGYKRFSSRPIDGRGIGVAIVDTGVDGTHPDLVSRMVSNVRIVCTNPGTVLGAMRECGGPKTAVPLDDTDTPGAGGHGTHVAGIVAGTGEASDGNYGGAAPGASLYGVGIGTVLLVENALDGLRWVLDNHDEVSPRIRVVNNSWGGGYFDPSDPIVSAATKLVDMLVAEGVTVVFAAGNDGGNGEAPQTSAQCVNPTRGVVCVANYDDAGTGTRDGTISPTSSKGTIGDPTTWPDLAAPGASIMSTCQPYLVVCVALGNTRTQPYGTMSGTSMAAPHVAGIVAQLLQINPKLTPAAIEDILEDTAYAFKTAGGYKADPANRGGKSSFDAGHGLVDARAAIMEASRRRR